MAEIEVEVEVEVHVCFDVDFGAGSWSGTGERNYGRRKEGAKNDGDDEIDDGAART